MVTRDSNDFAREVLKNIELLQDQLQLAQAGVSVAARALKAQDAEQDWDIACVLEHCAGRCLVEQMARLDELIYSLERCSQEPTEIEPPPAECMPLQ